MQDNYKIKMDKLIIFKVSQINFHRLTQHFIYNPTSDHGC